MRVTDSGLSIKILRITCSQCQRKSMPIPRPTTLVQVESEDWYPNTITEINRIQHKCEIHLLRLPQAGPR